ncbi:16S rRNA pseudouridine(516) synthase [Thalassotalea profundi]|uniref:Pseudouridine synthase n=1 Tax=Thalassotalea profundi TaxID=2036687 RepID=A0ABQ3IG92_9GAMM|nr:16S rRNA pseudouridine(516) synthase [Thalassotalea profundi]GHE83486.1 pseudouridine synthase [Thalassotalea profundi]
MSISRARLDRFVSEKCNISRRDVRLFVAQKRIIIDGEPASDISVIIDKFSKIVLDNKVLQNNTPCYVMLHKPTGVVSATKDKQHKTVIDLLTIQEKDQLHIVGRLDLNTSGLVLLTNDSRWSERITSPDKKVKKRYLVTLKNPLTDDYISAFESGMYFPFENITTQPATLRILSDHIAQVELTEGRYHQIKRMFGRFRNPVIGLHRESIGNLALDDSLLSGQSRYLTSLEVEKVFQSYDK